MRVRYYFLPVLAVLFILSGCSILENIALPPDSTTPQTTAGEAAAPSPEPTLGDPEFIGAVYCWESHIDEGEFNLIRFFPSGNLIDIYAQPFASCEDAWNSLGEYLVEESLMQFNHGTYHLSGEWIVFNLAPPNSDQVAGEVRGEYAVQSMHLFRAGADEPREYILIYTGE